ncbi:solute carrier family 35 member E1 isoform X3 [Hydra vulgaris]|uniref:Solute carrier family 35 member E1 isoform X3 n=1 Tax=Hydra vulgaris TaxID=6087 RepID=A0ABM4DIN4_HYDVU
MAKFSRSLKVTVLCVSWYLLSTTNNILGKKILVQYPYPLTITLFHMLSSSFMVYPVLLMAGINTQYRYSKHFMLRFIIPLGFGKLFGSIASHISIWRVTISYAHTVKASLPIFTVLLGRLIYKDLQSYQVYLSLLPIVFGVAIATITELSFEFYGMCSALLATFIFALQNLYSKLHSTADQLDLLGRLSMSSFINFLQSIVSFSVLHLLSPLSYSVANATKRVLVITVSLATLHNPVTLVNFFGMMLAVLGVYLYNRAKISQGTIKSILPTTLNDQLSEKVSDSSPRYRAFIKSNTFI